MANDVSRKNTVAWAIAILTGIMALIATDLWTDYRAGTTAGHLIIEAAVLLLSATGLVLLWREFETARSRVAGLRADVEAARQDAARWRRETKSAIEGFRAAIEGQFARWELSNAERDVAMYLLRGLSHKEIAMRRQTSERTVREQARSVYVKSGVGGRSELAAFFLEGLTVNGEQT